MKPEFHTCSCCHQQMLIKTKKPDAKSFAGCVGKDCGFQIPKVIFMKPLPEWAAEELMTSGHTSIIDGFKSTKKKRKFSACLMVDEKKKRICLDLMKTDLYR